MDGILLDALTLVGGILLLVVGLALIFWVSAIAFVAPLVDWRRERRLEKNRDISEQIRMARAQESASRANSLPLSR